MNAPNMFQTLVALSNAKLKEVVKRLLIESNNVHDEILSLLNDESNIERSDTNIVIKENNDQLIVDSKQITWCAEPIGPQVLVKF